MTKEQLEECMNAYGTEIYTFCNQLTRNKIEADDLYQDTFLKVVELQGKIDYEKNPKSYFVSIALRLWKNKKRKYAWRNRIAGMESLVEDVDIGKEVVGELSPEENFLKNEEKQMVQEAVARLEERYRIPIYLYYTIELSVEQIATLLKIPKGTVKSRLFKARKRLRQELEVFLDGTKKRFGTSTKTSPFSRK